MPPTAARTSRLVAPPAAVEHVVLLDERGRASGLHPKAAAHGPHTPLHLAFSCHVVGADGRVLLTRRAASKATWPATWTNGCCGHPQLGESLGEAVTRRLQEELGLTPTALAVAVPDFTYRAVMDDGTVEHELCPILVARVDHDPRPEPAEVDAFEWVHWPELLERVATTPDAISPWASVQIPLLARLAPTSLGAWLDEVGPAGPLLDWQPGLDAPTTSGALRAATGSTPPGNDLGVAPSAALAPVREPLDHLLSTFLAERRTEVLQTDPGLAEMVDEIEALVLAGGKRLRPAFVHWGHRATGADPDPEVLWPAAAVELLHTFALLHDDVMDRSTTRRGRPAAHASLTARHRAERREGDSDLFGTSGAILAGDLAFVWADEAFEAARLPTDALTRARRAFSTLRSEVVAGQYLDLSLAATPATAPAASPAEVMAAELAAAKVALLKSARYTVTRPLLIGASLAGPLTPATAAALGTYGDAVGIAFQMRDDVLGLFGDPDETGKGVLDDLREGKRTLLVLRAMRLATPDQRAVIAARLGDPDLDEAGAARVREVVAASGALASVEALIAASHATARASLRELPDAAEALEELAALAIERRS